MALPVIHNRRRRRAGAAAVLPSDFAGLQWQIKSDAGTFEDTSKTTPAADDDDPVKNWADQSGNGRDAAQTGPSRVPTLKLNIQNGLPAIRFIESEIDQMIITSMGIAAGDFTFIVVANPSNITGTRDTWLRSATDSLIITHTISTAAGRVGYFDGVAWRNIAAAQTGWQILSYQLAAPNGEVFRNGVSLGSDTYTQGALPDNTELTEASFGDADLDIGEMLLYSPALSDADMLSLVNNYLNPRWAIF